MNKLVKVFSIILFILLIIGIITPNRVHAAYSVSAGTSAQEMINNLGQGLFITNSVREANENIFCRQHGAILPESGATYKLESKKTFKNDAKAYILSSDYAKDDKQEAYWLSLGQTVSDASSNAKALYNTAVAYENYMKNVSKVVTSNEGDAEIVINRDDAKWSNSNKIYGPIKIQYFEDSSKGFYYAFFDEKGNYLGEKVQLCTKSNNKYNPISTTTLDDGDHKGYYIVNSNDYRGVDLYYKIDDNWETNDKVYLKVYRESNSSNYSGGANSSFSINKDSAETKSLSDGNFVAYGPLQIKYSYSSTAGVAFGGFCYAFFDQEGNNINERAQLCTLSNGTYKPISSTISNDGYYQVSTTEYSNIDLYVKANVADWQGRIFLKVYEKILETEAEVYQIAGTYTTTTTTQELCLSCLRRVKDYTKPQNLVSGNIVKYNGRYYKYINATTGKEKSDNTVYNKYNFGGTIVNSSISAQPQTSDSKYKCGGCSNTFSTTNNGLTNFQSHFVNTHFTKLGGSSGYNSYKCNVCGTSINDAVSSTTNRKAHALNHYSVVPGTTTYLVTTYNFILYTGCGNPNCGAVLSSGTYNAQKLSIVKGSKKETEKSYEIEIEIPLIPSIEFYPVKYNSYQAYEAEKRVDLDAEFKVEAKQKDNNGNIVDLNVKPNSDSSFTVIPVSKEHVYVLITEITAPEGYKTIDAINARFDFHDEALGKWFPTYAPSEEDWKSSGFEASTFNGWKWQEEGDETGDNKFPNVYKSSTNGDYIRVESSIFENNTWKFSVEIFDQAIIEKLTLLKVDEDGNNELLSGAKFTATFENVKEYTVGNKTFDGSVPYTFTVNGSVSITNVVYANENNPIVITIKEEDSDLLKNTREPYYYKKLEGPITITISHTPKSGLIDGKFTYDGTEKIRLLINGTPIVNDNKISFNSNGTLVSSSNNYEAAIVVPNLRLIDLTGVVWLDGDTGVKPVITPNGTMEDSEKRVSNVYVELGGEEGYVKQFDNNTAEYLADTATRTNENGQFSFKGLRYGHGYYVTFNYDGIHYITSNGANYNGAAENTNVRTNFNTQYQTINANMGLRYEYNSEARTSTLETLLEKNEAGKLYPAEKDGHLEMGDVEERFNMTASTKSTIYRAHGTNLNLGIEGRGTDVALSTNVYSADVSINGQTTTYNFQNTEESGIKWTYNDKTGTYEIISTTSKEIEKVDYNLKLYASDYNYRIRNYVSNSNFVNAGEEDSQTLNKDNELNVTVKYILQLQNQLDEPATIKKIAYKYDEDYTLSKIYYINNGNEVPVNYTENGHVISIEEDINFSTYGVKTLYLDFTVNKKADAIILGNFDNSAEIIEYYTGKGLIDKDSAPGNYMTSNLSEDDSDQARGLNIDLREDVRTISGYVYDADTNNKINDVIVQLIEVKKIGNQYYEYIWQETVSGKNTVKAMTFDGKELKTYSVENTEGEYRFIDYTDVSGDKLVGFIPGDYIIRFIYGDGTTYDLTNNIIKYNGQDYKSTIDEHYTSQWYNNVMTTYTTTNVARDNEARRLETMENYVEIDAEKGLLLKLLDMQTDEQRNAYVTELNNNLIEKNTFIATYNKHLDTDITDVTAGNVTDLQRVTLANTWMCAETSKVKVAVDTENLTNVEPKETVSGLKTIAPFEMTNIALGLTGRPRTQIRLEKEITTYILKASNGQELVTAYLDENGNLTGKTDNLQVIPGTSWKYSVSPTDLNTLIDGAHLEYAYRIKVINESEADYLGKKLTDVYNDNNNSVSNYLTALTDGVKSIKSTLRTSGYNNSIGEYLGSAYYTGVPTGEQVRTEVTRVRDYINNDVDYKAGVDFQKLEGRMSHYILEDGNNAVRETTIETVLDSKVTTGKLDNRNNNSYTYKEVTIGKDTISSTGVLDFDNYIAEVMSYTNAAGRRAFYIEKNDRGEITQVKSVTPGNAKAVDAETEIDESMPAKVQIGEAYGDDKQTNYTWLIAIVAGIAVVAVGAFVTKKYIIK